MAQNQTMRCYYHHNCEDRPAVARCSKCGKSLCRECAENLKSEDTGKILCVDCLNEEMAEDVVWAECKKSAVKKEMIFIIVGFVIGLAIEIFLFSMAARNDEMTNLWLGLFTLSFIYFLPTLLASFSTIIKQVLKIRFGNSFIVGVIRFIVRLVYFNILCVLSPIIFIWRIVKRAKDIKLLKRFAHLQFLKYQANEEYAEIASKMTTRLTTEEFERNMQIKYGEMLKTNKEEAEKRIAAEREKNDELMQKNAEGENRLKELSVRMAEYERENAQIRAEGDENAKKSARNARKARKESRSTDDVDDIAA